MTYITFWHQKTAPLAHSGWLKLDGFLDSSGLALAVATVENKKIQMNCYENKIFVFDSPKATNSVSCKIFMTLMLFLLISIHSFDD